jgi:uncharacterized protein (DUF736 family)
MRLGQFIQYTDDTYRGTVSFLGLGTVEVATQRVISKEGDPYIKLVGDPDNTAYEIGALFEKKKANGEIYFSVAIDSPLLPNPISAALFRDRDSIDLFNLVWQRPEQQIKAAPDASARRQYVGANVTP